MTFQIHALDPAPFLPLLNLDNAQLGQHRAKWCEVDTCPGFPCRVSLEDAPVGSRVLLVNYCHQEGNSPYHASHAIFIRPGVEQARPAPGTVPDSLASRLISWRAFDADHMMIQADVAEGHTLSSLLPDVLADDSVAYVHLHNAKPGCFAARVTRI